jgi:hypothetical protein
MVHPKNRCQCKTKKNTVCKHSFNVIFNNKRYCVQHANMHMSDRIIFIQKIWRGYKCRKFLNNVYLKLPDDIQCHIQSFVKQDLKIKKWNQAIKKLYIFNLKKIFTLSSDCLIIHRMIPREITNYTGLDYLKQITKIYKWTILLYPNIDQLIIDYLYGATSSLLLNKLSPRNLAVPPPSQENLYKEYSNTYNELHGLINDFKRTNIHNRLI